MKRIVIIGGGITGLAAAHHVLEQDRKNNKKSEVILLEATSRVGGIVRTEHRDGFLIEHGPDSFISEKPAALELARRIGLESRLTQTNEKYRRSSIVRKGRLLPVPAGFHLLAPSRFLPFFRSSIFSWRAKARIASEVLLPRSNPNGSADESLASFVKRRFGHEALERMAQPMVGGIYTADPEQLSLRATFPRFLDWEQNHGSVIRALRRRKTSEGLHAESTPERSADSVSGARYSLFLSFDKGMQVLTDELERQLPNGIVQLNSGVRQLQFDRANSQWDIVTDAGVIEADAICLTTPAYISAELLREIHPSLATTLAEIKYESSATVNFAFRRNKVGNALDGFGFVVPFIEQRSLIACTFSSVKFSGRAPDDCVLLRAFVGGALQREVLDLDDDEIVQRVERDLSQLLQIKGRPIFWTIGRWERSMPQYHVGHLERVARIKEFAAELPGLHLAGAAFSGVGIPDCVKSGETAAEKIAAG
jgi:protoporphyrinogen/coproporphyrinogen III oxidase